MLWNKTQEFRLLALLVPQHQLLEHPATTSSRALHWHTITDKKRVPSCQADVWKAENPPQFPSTAQPRGQSWCWWLRILGEVSWWESHLQENHSSHFPGPLRAAQPQPLPWAPLAAGSGTGELSLSCPLPGAPLGRCCPGSQRVRGEDSAALVQPHLLFAASPSPAFGRLQVTASQGSLKVLCSHFLPLPPSPWIALIFHPYFPPTPKQIPVLRTAWWAKHR